MKVAIVHTTTDMAVRVRRELVRMDPAATLYALGFGSASVGRQFDRILVFGALPDDPRWHEWMNKSVLTKLSPSADRDNVVYLAHGNH